MKQKRCIYCGRSDATERDHVPPKCLFPKPLPTNLITVPACSKCNRELSEDEKYFRSIVSQLAETENHPASKKILNDRIVKRLKREPKLALRILSTVKPVKIIREGKHVATVAAYDVDNQSYDRVMVKIIKGLVYHETGLIVPSSFSIKWNVLREPLQLLQNLRNRATNIPKRVIGDGVFAYEGYVRRDDVRSLWVMQFYEGVTYSGVVYAGRHFA